VACKNVRRENFAIFALPQPPLVALFSLSLARSAGLRKAQAWCR
jgi:hypothetical protein